MTKARHAYVHMSLSLSTGFCTQVSKGCTILFNVNGTV